MPGKFSGVFSAVCKILVTSFLAIASSSYVSAAELEFQECAFSANSLNLLPTQLQCGVYKQSDKVLEVQLPFVILKASAGRKAEEALIVVPGGPGYGAQTSADSVQYWQQYFSTTAHNFDLILIEPRGTPNALPSLTCKQFQHSALEIVASNLSSSQEYANLMKLVRSCAGALEYLGEGFGVSSKQQARDLENLMDLTAYKKIHLLGESWGTRVVLQVSSKKLASRILDSPYPPGKGDVEDWFANVDMRFDVYRRYFSNFDALWAQARDQLNDKPLVGKYKTGLTQPFDEIEYVLNEHRLVNLAFYALYHENMRVPFHNALLYVVADNSEKNSNKDSFVDLLVSYLHSYFDPAFSPLAWYAAECAERPRISDAEYASLAKHYAKYRYFIAGMREFDICQLPEFQPDEDAETSWNLNTRLPTLILSGQYDPVTPSRWAEELAETMGANKADNKTHLYVARGAGHGILANDYCRTSLLFTFLENLEVNPAEHCD